MKLSIDNQITRDAIDLAGWSAENGGLSFNCLLANDFAANADLLAEFDGSHNQSTYVALEAVNTLINSEN